MQTAVLGLVTLGLTALSVYLSISHALQLGEQPLRAAALGLLVGMGGGLLVGLVYLWQTLQSSLPILTLLRTGFALGIVMLLGRFWPVAGSVGLLGSKVGTILCAALAGIVYLMVLLLSGELSVKELALLRRERPQTPTADA